jgi:hypothetical protein
VLLGWWPSAPYVSVALERTRAPAPIGRVLTLWITPVNVKGVLYIWDTVGPEIFADVEGLSGGIHSGRDFCEFIFANLLPVDQEASGSSSSPLLHGRIQIQQ